MNILIQPMYSHEIFFCKNVQILWDVYNWMCDSIEDIHVQYIQRSPLEENIGTRQKERNTNN